MDTLSGLALPATRTSGGYFATKRGVDVAWGDLLIAVLCPISGRFFNRSFGSALPNALFDPNDALLAQEIDRYIREATTKYVPGVKILDVQVASNGKSLSLTVSFSYTGTIATRTTRIDRHSAIQFISARSR